MVKNSLSKEALDILESSGWVELKGEDADLNPKALYDEVCKVIPKISQEGCHYMIQELVEMDPSKYDSLRAFLVRFN